MINLICVLLILHLFADFFFQSNWMALNKSKNNVALGIHVFVYSLVMLGGLFLTSFLFHLHVYAILAFVGINALLHFATDYATSRISSHFWITEQRSYFWQTIGSDQCIHALTLIKLAEWLLVH